MNRLRFSVDMPLWLFGFFFEVFPVRHGKAVNQPLQGLRRIRLRIHSEIAAYDLIHVELARLDPVRRKQPEKALPPVNDDNPNPVTAGFNAAYGVLIIGIGLAPDEVHVQRHPRSIVMAEHDTPIVTPCRWRRGGRCRHLLSVAAPIPETRRAGSTCWPNRLLRVSRQDRRRSACLTGTATIGRHLKAACCCGTDSRRLRTGMSEFPCASRFSAYATSRRQVIYTCSY